MVKNAGAIKTWRERIGADASFPLHAPTDVERAMVGEIEDLRAQLAHEPRSGADATPRADDFARIVRATSGQQVLFFKKTHVDDGNYLHCVANFDGFQSDIEIAGIPDANFVTVLDQVNVEMADAVLAQVVELGLEEVPHG